MTDETNDHDHDADESFWSPTVEITEAPLIAPDMQSALERLGPVPFPKSGFPFLGFLATVYDQVATNVGCATKTN